MPQLRLGIAQTNVVVGDLEGNAVLLAEGIAQARAAGCALVAFPELALTGYPPEDLLLKPRFVERNLEVLAELAAQVHGIVAVIGFVDRVGDALANAAAVCADGAVVSVYRKRRLPNYAVFDEQRYFVPGDEPLALVDVAGVRVGVTICEDAWWPGGPMRDLAAGGAELLVNVNASPYHRGKVAQREAMLAERAAEVACPIAYVNLVGGQDELVFDGASLVIGGDGVVQVRAPQYEDGLIVADIDVPARPAPANALPVVAALGNAPTPVGAATPSAVLVDDAAEVYGALVLGLRDYVRKNGFAEVVIGLSGGIDSSLVACVAVDALGAEHVHGVLMPSRFSSDHSVVDAEDLAV
ncbi:MAG: NAD+ synthase, partial [Acidimicrobiales bacterium]|nr:NAD+ synthase [Acidimicrobiales bacterium]